MLKLVNYYIPAYELPVVDGFINFDPIQIPKLPTLIPRYTLNFYPYIKPMRVLPINYIYQPGYLHPPWRYNLCVC